MLNSSVELRSLLTARELQLRIVAQLSATGGWTLYASPLQFIPSIEWLELHGHDPGSRVSL